MGYVYICGAVSEEMNNVLGRSIAGNKFSLNMAKELDRQCGGKLTVISTASVSQNIVDCWGGEIWTGKKLYLAPRGKRFPFTELKQRRSILKLLNKIQKSHPGEKLTVFLENSPFAPATACAAIKKKFDIACYSITIDTPFTREFRSTGIRGKVSKWLFLQGRKALRHFDGLISFTEDVKKDLQVDIPFCPLTIGCQQDMIPAQLPQITEKKTVVYAGTLIYYNGILELLQAFSLLGAEYELHIYGYGPLEEDVRQAAAKYVNIHFHGRFAPEETKRILSAYQLLINPRHIDPGIENFTFPSKMVDYILTGKSVLSSNFKTMPHAYREFVYILDDLKPESIVNGVQRVFADTPTLRQARAQAGIRYIKENQTYENNVKRILSFTEQETR